jgi:hypothetical protein
MTTSTRRRKLLPTAGKKRKTAFGYKNWSAYFELFFIASMALEGPFQPRARIRRDIDLAITFNIARTLLTLLEAITPTFGRALVSVQTDISRTSPRRLGTRGIQRFAYRNPAHQAQCRQATSVTCTVRKMDDR